MSRFILLVVSTLLFLSLPLHAKSWRHWYQKRPCRYCYGRTTTRSFSPGSSSPSTNTTAVCSQRRFACVGSSCPCNRATPSPPVPSVSPAMTPTQVVGIPKEDAPEEDAPAKMPYVVPPYYATSADNCTAQSESCTRRDECCPCDGEALCYMNVCICSGGPVMDLDIPSEPSDDGNGPSDPADDEDEDMSVDDVVTVPQPADNGKRNNGGDTSSNKFNSYYYGKYSGRYGYGGRYGYRGSSRGYGYGGSRKKYYGWGRR